MNGPALCVVAGTEAAITAFETRLSAQGTMVRRLETSHAFHSAMMDPVARAVPRGSRARHAHAPAIPFVSNVTGTWITAAEATSPDYWTTHLRQAVRFAAGVQELLQDPTRVFLEVGPGRTLASLVRQQGPLAQGRTIADVAAASAETTADLAGVLQTLGRLWLAGVEVDWAGFYEGESRRRVPLPTYPFERQRYWIDAPKSALPRELPPLEKENVADWFYRAGLEAIEAERPAAALATPRPLDGVRADTGSGLGARRRRSSRRHRTRPRHRSAGRSVSAETAPTVRSRSIRATPEHYRALFTALKDGGSAPGSHRALLGRHARNAGLSCRIPSRVSGSGFYSLLYLAQALGESGSRASIRIGVVTTDAAKRHR